MAELLSLPKRQRPIGCTHHGGQSEPPTAPLCPKSPAPNSLSPTPSGRGDLRTNKQLPEVTSVTQCLLLIRGGGGLRTTNQRRSCPMHFRSPSSSFNGRSTRHFRYDSLLPVYLFPRHFRFRYGLSVYQLAHFRSKPRPLRLRAAQVPSLYPLTRPSSGLCPASSAPPPSEPRHFRSRGRHKQGPQTSRGAGGRGRLLLIGCGRRVRGGGGRRRGGFGF